MSATTAIEWTDRTWNPVTGCRKVSPGCKHCYAEGVALRFWATQYPPVDDGPIAFHGEPVKYLRPRRFTDVRTHEDRLLEPLSWKKPARVFVNSMSDLFHEDVPDAFIDQVFAVKQLGANPTWRLGNGQQANSGAVPAESRRCAGMVNAKGGEPSEWPEDLRVREFPR